MVDSEKDAKVALVIGGGTGMGFASAQRLAKRGVGLVLSGRRQSVLAEAQQRIKDDHAGAAVEILAGDAGIEAESQRMVKAAIDGFGRLDILIGAAGIYDDVAFLD